MSAVRVLSVADLPGAGAVRVVVDGVPVAVVRDEDGGVHAVGDTCSHANVSLSEGEVEDCTIECWLHGSRFDLRTGQPLSLPAMRPVPVYPVTLDGDDVLVDVTTTLGGQDVAAAAKEN
ncbi:MAG: non-heme iron oxygenase ferredoxin subunit [Kineosporiaceae bacterium]